MYSANENIKYYRKLVGMTQKDLADGICDISTLFRIEKGDQIPRLDILSAICQKLKVPLDYIVSNISHLDLSEIEKYKRLCREFTYSQDYISLLIIIEEFETFIEKHNNQVEYPYIQRYIQWHKAIYSHEKEHDISKAEIILKSIYDGRLLTELDIGVCNSLGLIKLDKEGVVHALPFFKSAYNAVTSLPLMTDPTLSPRVGYNLAYCYYYQWNMEEAITVAFKVLELLETNHLSFMLGKTKHMIGKIFQRQEEYEQAEEYLTQSIYLFHIESKQEYFNQAQKDLEELIDLKNSSTN